jgi:hypothetical protein
MIGEMLGRLTFFAMLPFLVMLVVGGIYFLAMRPRVSFRQAIFRWWVVLAGFVFFFLALFGQVARRL